MSPTATPAGKSPQSKTRVGVVLVLAILAAIIVGIYRVGSSISSGGGTADSDTTALSSCEDQVKAWFANPETVAFQITTMSIDPTRISGQVLAQNSFGVPSRFNFVCDRHNDKITNAAVAEA